MLYSFIVFRYRPCLASSDTSDLLYAFSIPLTALCLQMLFSSYSLDDDDYKGYDYSLFGRLSEVRIVFLYRFVQEVRDFNFIR